MATTITAAELRRLKEIDARIQKLRERERDLSSHVARVARERMAAKTELEQLVEERDHLAQGQLLLFRATG